MFAGPFYGQTYFPSPYWGKVGSGAAVNRSIAFCIDLPRRPTTLDLPQRATIIDMPVRPTTVDLPYRR